MTEATSAATGEAMPELKLRWQQTQPDRDAHYTAATPSFGTIGCIFLRDDGAWGWAMTADDYDISRNCGPMNGTDRSARHAAKRVEDAWFAAIRGSRHDVPVLKVNAYAAARYRHENAA